MIELAFRILNELVSVDYLGRPINNKQRRSCMDVRQKIDANPRDFYEVVKQLHLNYLIDVENYGEENGTLTIRDEGIHKVAAEIIKKYPIE